MRRRSASAAVLASAVLAFGASVAPAGAATAADGAWYVDALNYPQAWDAGWTGEGVTVAVIDSPVNPDVAALAGVDLTVREPSFCHTAEGDPIPATSTDPAVAFHGTNVVGLVAGNGASDGGGAGPTGAAPGASVRLYAVSMRRSADLIDRVECLDAAGEDGLGTAIANAIDEAVDDGADIITTSLGAAMTDEIAASVARAERAGAILLFALSNQVYSGVSRGVGHIESANGAIAVAALGSDLAVQSTDGRPNAYDIVTVANAGIGMPVVGVGDWGTAGTADGTSYATPLTAGMLAAARQKHAGATPNQLIQLLLHHTGGQNPDLVWDEQIGYGVPSLTNMLAADPAQYPDENPLLRDDDRARPSIAEVVGDGGLGDTGDGADGADLAAGAPDEDPVPPSTGSPVLGVLGIVGAVVGGLAAIVVLAGVVLLIALRARRAKPREDIRTDGIRQGGV